MQRNKKLFVTKASGLTESFSIRKLRKSLARAKATPDEINGIVDTILPRLYQGISTQKIYSEAFRLLRGQSKSNAARYYLKKGIMDLGPSGFPFEKFVGELFRHQGYAVQVGRIVEGKCVQHEIDIIAEKEKELFLMECKYRNQPGIAVDVKTPLYIHARFQDVLAKGLFDTDRFTGWIVTNSRFTNDALAFGNCKGLRMLGWSYPQQNALKEMIDNSGLYPLTCLTSLTSQEKKTLLAGEYVLIKDIYKNTRLLKKTGLSEKRINTVYEEGHKLCQSNNP